MAKYINDEKKYSCIVSEVAKRKHTPVSNAQLNEEGKIKDPFSVLCVQ